MLFRRRARRDRAGPGSFSPDPLARRRVTVDSHIYYLSINANETEVLWRGHFINFVKCSYLPPPWTINAARTAAVDGASVSHDEVREGLGRPRVEDHDKLFVADVATAMVMMDISSRHGLNVQTPRFEIKTLCEGTSDQWGKRLKWANQWKID
ncbi:hypothetical protein EVAR_14518_1 [Eumeta japonica]|uniref:Uncharacterized protein n=1 Tax=Eumeta variegata TaxID=151549 RepID=A0A4C1U395_EUMVA|nr:hypothetical protein EVAR_14518_1 [Eumeta japonica]